MTTIRALLTEVGQLNLNQCREARIGIMDSQMQLLVRGQAAAFWVTFNLEKKNLTLAYIALQYSSVVVINACKNIFD